MAGAYLVLSLPFSIVCIVRPHIIGARLMLLVFDTVLIKLSFFLIRFKINPLNVL